MKYKSIQKSKGLSVDNKYLRQFRQTKIELCTFSVRIGARKQDSGESVNVAIYNVDNYETICK